jgi:hypothetical protein
MEQLAPGNVLEAEIELGRRLKSELEGHNERMIDVTQNVSFRENCVHFIRLKKRGFVNGFDRKTLMCLGILTKHHFAIEAAANHRNYVEIRH